MFELDESHLRDWAEHRIVVLRGALDEAWQRRLHDWIEELASWPEQPGAWMKYFEGDERQLCRVENFLPYHEGLRDLLERADLSSTLATLLGEPVRLFKEKVNFKGPGGRGFAPHQDAPAFAAFGQTWHVTLMLGIDAATPENGGLDFVRGWQRREALDQAPDGTLRDDVARQLEWTPLETCPGDAVFFDSWVPHRSGANPSASPRRALYVTWNGVSEGDRRGDYFEAKRAAFPPECERTPDHAPPAHSAFNLGNPIR